MMTPSRPAACSCAATAALVVLALGLASTAGWGCSSDSSPYNRLTSLRVLALRSDPAVPLPGQTATLSAKVFTPSPDPQAPTADDPSLTYAWSWCPFPGTAGTGYPCLVTNDEVQSFTGGLAPALDLGTNPTASLAYPADFSTLDSAVCQGKAGMAGLDCTGGIPILIRLVVTTASDPKWVTSVFTMRLGRTAADANTNPEISGLAAVVNGAPVGIDASNSNHVSLVRDVENALQLPADLVNQSETYAGTDDSGNPATVQERLFVTWFVETGDTKQQSTGLILGTTDPQVFLQDTWTPATSKDYPRTSARIFLVIRDNRGGVGWFPGQVDLTEVTP